MGYDKRINYVRVVNFQEDPEIASVDIEHIRNPSVTERVTQLRMSEVKDIYYMLGEILDQAADFRKRRDHARGSDL